MFWSWMIWLSVDCKLISWFTPVLYLPRPNSQEFSLAPMACKNLGYIYFYLCLKVFASYFTFICHPKLLYILADNKSWSPAVLKITLSQTGNFKQQNFLLWQFWRLETQNQGVDRTESFWNFQGEFVLVFLLASGSFWTAGALWSIATSL